MMIQLLKAFVSNVSTALISVFVLLFTTSSHAVASQKIVGSGAKLQTTLTVQVQSADGNPLPNVTVVCIGPDAWQLQVRDGRVVEEKTITTLKGTTIEGGTARLQTDAEGRFSLPFSGTNVAVVVANDKGFGLVQSRDLMKNPTIVVSPWSCIEGVRLNRGQPVMNQQISYHLSWRSLVSEDLWNVLEETFRMIQDKAVSEYYPTALTDSEGRFVFEHVPPVKIGLDEMHKHPGKLWVSLQLMDVVPSETNRIKIVTEGRTVVGHLELGAGLTNKIDFAGWGWLRPDVDERKVAQLPSIPEEFDTLETRAKWWRSWDSTDAGRQRVELLSRTYLIEFRSDGSCIADLIKPGQYRITGDVVEHGKLVALLNELVEIPPAGTNTGDALFDLGKLTLQAPVNLKTGDVAPDFSVKTLDDKPLKLSDFRGKYVLLDFWATWCGPCVEETPNLKATYEAFGKDPRFVMISLSKDSDREAPGKFVKAKGLSWTQAFLGGDWSKDIVAQNYGIMAIPQIMLIGPDGKIIARDLRGPKIKEVVAAALGK